MRSFEGLSVHSSSMRHVQYLEEYCRRTGSKDILARISRMPANEREELNEALGKLFMPRTLGEVDKLAAQLVRASRIPPR